jgi:organic hydroperoxide reductase OsmC/OhrA
MDATQQLRGRKTPLMEKYRSTPGAALSTLKAKSSVDANAIICGVETGFQAIRLRFAIISAAPPEKLDQLMNPTERYCVVCQSLKGNAAFAASLQNAPPT